MADYTRATKARRRRAKPGKGKNPRAVPTVDAMKTGPRPSARAMERANPNAAFKRTTPPKVNQTAKAVKSKAPAAPNGPRPGAFSSPGKVSSPISRPTYSSPGKVSSPISSGSTATPPTRPGKSASAPGQRKKALGLQSASSLTPGASAPGMKKTGLRPARATKRMPRS